MFGIPEWAIGTGVIIVGVFTGIAVLIRMLPPELRGPGRKRLSGQERETLEEMQTRIGEVESLKTRLAEVEERLDFTERLLAQRPDAERLAPPKSQS